ncbi:MAG: hypothetical protein NDI73_11220 [Desulfuromonadales bacterium]|nr:hypothetical protein [Desulfuromonadales bacterium]
MSLLTLLIAFSALTLVLVAILGCYLRWRVAEGQRTAREQVGDAPPPALKEEE